jgi:hypothetical protein
VNDSIAVRAASCILAAVLLMLGGVASAETPARTEARAALLDALANYRPGAAPDAALVARIDSAAAALERTAATPDLRDAADLATGTWLTRFSSQGVFGEIDVAFMTRALPGGGAAGGKARVEQVLQELDPAKRFYRNTMVLNVGAEALPVLYFATADLGVSPTRPNDLEVSFKRIEFVAGRAGISQDALRRALGLADTTPLAIDVPAIPGRGPSVSSVTYLDEQLRINRGKDYIAVLEKVR